MTKTIRKEILSGSENKHYAYYCGKCKMIKTPVEDILKRIKRKRTD